jgi:hypothetical protein
MLGRAEVGKVLQQWIRKACVLEQLTLHTLEYQPYLLSFTQPFLLLNVTQPFSRMRV